jgi:hypothetical protein
MASMAGIALTFDLSTPVSIRIPVLDLREGGPVAHARQRRAEMLALRDACFSMAPPLRSLAGPLDRISRAWLKRSASPYADEVARIAEIAGRPGVWFVNASYEWGCTTRIDVDPVPMLRRTLDWPFPGLGRHVEVALQDGGAGLYANVTWPGAVGVLTALAPGRFAAAINQAPMYRRIAHAAGFPIDVLLNGIGTWRRSAAWPAAHLLRRAFDSCRSYDEAVTLLTEAPLARPTLFSIAGVEPGQGCLIERTETEARVVHGGCVIANDWHPDSSPRAGRWTPRGGLLGQAYASERRCRALAECEARQRFDWLTKPVLNPVTRLAVEAIPSAGLQRVVGFEPVSRGLGLGEVVPVTEPLEMVVAAHGVVRSNGFLLQGCAA